MNKKKTCTDLPSNCARCQHYGCWFTQMLSYHEIIHVIKVLFFLDFLRPLCKQIGDVCESVCMQACITGES